jgi:hypothetical protein
MSHRVSIVMEKTVVERCKAAAAAHGLSFSAWVRMACLSVLRADQRDEAASLLRALTDNAPNSSPQPNAGQTATESINLTTTTPASPLPPLPDVYD